MCWIYQLRNSGYHAGLFPFISILCAWMGQCWKSAKLHVDQHSAIFNDSHVHRSLWSSTTTSPQREIIRDRPLKPIYTALVARAVLDAAALLSTSSVAQQYALKQLVSRIVPYLALFLVETVFLYRFPSHLVLLNGAHFLLALCLHLKCLKGLPSLSVSAFGNNVSACPPLLPVSQHVVKNTETQYNCKLGFHMLKFSCLV